MRKEKRTKRENYADGIYISLKKYLLYKYKKAPSYLWKR